MEGSEDEENTAPDRAAFGDEYRDSEGEADTLGRRTHGQSLERSEKSSWSRRSRAAGCEEVVDASLEDQTGTSQESLHSSGRRSITREKSMSNYHTLHRHRGLGRFEGNGQDDFEFDQSSEGESQRRRDMSSEEGVTDEENGGETVIETSCDETSFNTSIYSYKETGSSSEISIDPVVWKKFKFLSSILKETQHNLRAMDDLILEHHRLQGQPAALPQPSQALHQGLGEGEAKTDEAKLEEILSLLHHLTHTLSSYEQHPLLASTPHLQVISTSLHPDSAQQQAQSSFRGEGTGREATVALCHPSPLEGPGPAGHTLQPCTHLPSLGQPLSPSKDAKFTESCEGRSVSFTTPAAGGTYNGFTPSFQISPDSVDARLLRDTRQGMTGDAHSHVSSHYLLSNRNVDNMSPRPMVSELSKAHKKDTVSQTDPFLLVPRLSEERQPPHNGFTSQAYPPESLHSHQEPLHHPLMKETRSLRKDIDDIVARKQALDSRLQSLIAHRAMQRELETTDFDETRQKLTPLTKSKSLEESELRKSKSKHRKYKSRSKSYEEESQVSQVRRRNGSQESYLSMINENQDEFPSLTMGSLDNEDKITELQTDEAELPGLGDSGLSSEINSINATIQELVRENQQLHKFLQGMTSESLLKVDQEKLALEARLQSLDKENQSLKISLDEEQELAHSMAKAPKGVKFSISEESAEQESDRETKEAKMNKVKDSSEPDSISEALTLSTKAENDTQKPSVSGSEPASSAREGEEGAAQYSPHDTVSHLRAEIERLTNQNQQLVNIIEKERNVGSGERDSPRMLKSQSINEEVSLCSTGESLTDQSNVTREMEKLQQKIKKLVEEKEILEFKLSREASERDFESTRLEARIQILNDKNQMLTQKLQDCGNLSKAKKTEISCQTDTLGLKSNGTVLVHDVENGQIEETSIEKQNKTSTSAVSQNSKAQHNYGSPDKLITSTTSKASPPVSAKITVSSASERRAEEILEKGSGRQHTATLPEDSLYSRPHLKDLPLSMFSSDENISTDDDKISLIRTPREDTHNSHSLEAPPVSVTEASIIPGDIHHTIDVMGRMGSGATGLESVSHSKGFPSDGSKQGSQIQQLEVLVSQNKAIATSLSELKTLSKMSESNREAAFTKIMEENVRVMQNIGEKLVSAGQPPSSTEPDARFTKLSHENQELKTTLQQQQKRIETLINQNSSLEKKLHVVQREHKEGRRREDARSTASSDSSHQDDTLNTMETKGKKSRKLSKEGLSDASVDSLSSEKQRESVETSRVSIIEKEQPIKSLNTGQASSSVHARGEGSRPISPSPDQADSSRSQVEGSQQSGSSESSRKESPGSAREKRRRSSTVLDPETQQLIDSALRKDKEKRMHLLEEAEREKVALQERIMTLVQENDTLAARLQEVVNVSRNLSGHMHSVKDQLEKVEAEKDDLHRKVRSLEDGHEDSSLSLSDSISSSRLTQRLKERIRSLQNEVERGWQEAHQRTVERDKAMAEKESLEYTSSIAINTARKEAESLREQLAALQEDRERYSLEQTNLKNELERKSVMAKAAQDTQASHLERLVEAERRIESMQIVLKRLEEQLAKEELARKSAEEELEKVKARSKSMSSPCESERERTALGGEQQWASTIAHLRNQLQQEHLQVRLLEAGEQESSARVLTLQRDIRDALAANQQLQDKYNQLRAAYRVKRAEKTSHREFSQHYTTQVKELGKTTAALEESFKVMLSALGESIEVTVELFASHVFLTPCLTHPGPVIHQDPEAWFGAQQGRLRWLQNQLRKLCLHNWKTGNLPRTSNLDVSQFEVSFNESQISPAAGRSQEKREGEQRAAGRASRTRQPEGKVDLLSELSILDENRSYTSTPVRRSSASDISLSTAFSPTKFGGEAKHSTLKPLPKFEEVKSSGMTPRVQQGSLYLSEAERILTSQQRELSEVKHRQYIAIIHSLQQEIDQSMAPSPSIPSSIFTTPEKKTVKYPQNLMEEEDDDSLSSGMSLAEVYRSQAVSPTSGSPSGAESSTSTHSFSGNSVKNVTHTPKEEQDSQSSPEKKLGAESMVSPKTKDDFQECPQELENGVNTKQSSRSSSRCSLIKSSLEEGVIGGKGEDVKQVRSSSLKEDEQSHGLDVDKDRDSWEQEEVEEDFIRTLVHSES